MKSQVVREMTEGGSLSVLQPGWEGEGSFWEPQDTGAGVSMAGDSRHQCPSKCQGLGVATHVQ